ncbi:hypothetical protein MAPG_04346 [Magnaporthiopsis poae ATCC 64411]|uniref:Lipocalin-like domain-containing protein n=1 Tax=Magnaporthiopsis poae (strain ATCC 64411 / 73-15) TaxID=644358 RepID=A0A0C4DWG6_MAGP6|nr:hypothetical protein MAPG_04346 [Magnaporthiopsis poae ATCC 64411]
MAAPPSKTLRDLNGKWVMNKTLSDSTEPALALQGIGWLYLKRGWIGADQPGGDDEHVESLAESVDNGWVALQIWGFQLVGGERRYVRNIVVTKGSEKVEMRLVYDWAGEELDFEV